MAKGRSARKEKKKPKKKKPKPTVASKTFDSEIKNITKRWGVS
jgi:hypothetical protein|tara:strand:+ start:206 stop:334 length:129 start_codon:yes stop_codon:yes gene_type:complete